MNLFKFLAFALLAVALTFTACGGDSGSGASDEISMSSDDEPGTSSGKSTAKSSDDDSDRGASSRSISSSSWSSAGATGAKNSSSGSTQVPESSSGISSAKGSSSSSVSLSKKCKEEQEGQTKKVVSTGIRYICEGGLWVEVSSSSEAVSSSGYYDMTNQFNPKVEYGEFTDPRDGRKYRTVTMDYKYHMRGVDSVTIFAENLNYGEMVPGGTVQGDSTKYCYADDPWYCENGWGGLYTWSAAMGFPAACDTFFIESDECPSKFDYSNKNEKFDGDPYFLQHQGICPEGWHVMNEDIWVIIDEKTGGHTGVAADMGSQVAGFGNQSTYGLSLLPAGQWNPLDLCFAAMGRNALYWLPQQYPDYADCSYRVAVRKNEFDRTFRGLKTQAFSVRCVKNY